MGKRITAGGGLTFGLDLSDQTTEACVLDAAGEVVERFRVRRTAAALERALARFEPSRVIREVGTHSPWVSRLVTRLGHEAGLVMEGIGADRLPLDLPKPPAAGRRTRRGWGTRDDSRASGRCGLVHSRAAGSSMPGPVGGAGRHPEASCRTFPIDTPRLPSPVQRERSISKASAFLRCLLPLLQSSAVPAICGPLRPCLLPRLQIASCSPFAQSPEPPSSRGSLSSAKSRAPSIASSA